ncbi:hypothetical protein EDB80DRAFT_833058 [Ilyonectria destructans]|nr:hypothetical protein EDB80DRAFT_833058 [Ilyonectria destructans]
MSTVVDIAGLTGKFAQCVAKELQVYPNVSIKGFCRSPQKLPRGVLEKYNIGVIQGGFDDETAVQELVQGTDVVICCYFGDSNVMNRGQKILIDTCAKEGVPRYLPSDFAKVAGMHVLVGGLIETFWSEFFRIFDANTQTITYWGTGDENVSEIKEIYENIYQSNLHLNHLGSLDELYSTVKDKFKKEPNNVMAWAPGCFAYWCTNGVARLGDNLDNTKYPGIVPNEDVAIADQQLGF